MADCGATALFINSTFAQLQRLKFIPMQHLCDLTVADSRTVSSGTITHIVQIESFALEAYTKSIELFVTILGQYLVVLGLPWLRKHNPRIRFKDNTITFDSEHCLEHCITSTHQATTICSADTVFDTLHETPRTHKTLQKTYKTPQTHETHETRCSTPKPQYSPRSSYHIDMVGCTKKMN